MRPEPRLGERGSATSDLWWFLAIMAALWFLWYATGGPLRPEVATGPFIETPTPVTTVGGGEIHRASDELTPLSPELRSPWSGQVRISGGNARYEIQSGKEYIEITADYQNPAPINITGWRLVNNPARRARSMVATIPAAANLFISTTAGQLAPIMLSPGGRAIMVTGAPPSRTAWPLRQSFRLNKCVGYLEEEFDTLNLTPSLPRDCPDPADEPGVATLPDKCYNFVRSLSSCHEPEFKEDREGVDRVDGRVDDLTRACRLYVEEHFNYNACVKWHERDPDFYTDDWRVYFNQPWELWAENRERITLYDESGKLVDELAY
ncbi:MAG: hypothetical protein AAB415_01795 [Patescibacteria group bacterium]